MDIFKEQGKPAEYYCSAGCLLFGCHTIERLQSAKTKTSCKVRFTFKLSFNMKCIGVGVEQFLTFRELLDQL